MKRIDIKITFQCNNHCKFCVQGDERKFCADKSFDEIKLILKKSKKYCSEVIFTGGEPTIRQDIIELVGYAKKLGYIIQIQTNGRMFIYEDFCKKMINAGADKFAISIHGHNKELHDCLTSIKGSFQQSIMGISRLLWFNKIVVTNTVINKLNYRFLPKIAKFLINLGISQYQFSFPHILGFAFKNRHFILQRKKEIMPYVKKGIEIGIKKGATPKIEAIPYCCLKGCEYCLTDQDIPDTKIIDIRTTSNFTKWRKEEGKVKGVRCKECKYFFSCEGPWREYPQLYGWEEFQPVL